MTMPINDDHDTDDNVSFGALTGLKTVRVRTPESQRGLTLLLAIIDNLALLAERVKFGLVDGRFLALEGLEVFNTAAKANREGVFRMR